MWIIIDIPVTFNNNYIFFYLFQSLLQKAITKDSGIRFEDRSSVFTSVINSSPEGVESVIDFVRENYDKMWANFKIYAINFFFNNTMTFFFSFVSQLRASLQRERYSECNWKEGVHKRALRKGNSFPPLWTKLNILIKRLTKINRLLFLFNYLFEIWRIEKRKIRK